jgi:hypothetical protein
MPRLPHKKYEMLKYRLSEHMRIVRKIESELRQIVNRSRPSDVTESDWMRGIQETIDHDDSVARVGWFEHTLPGQLNEIAAYCGKEDE